MESSSPDPVPPVVGRPRHGKSLARAAVELGTLRELRSLLGSRTRRLAVVAVAAIFALLSMLVGGMLTFVPTQGAYTTEIIWWGAPADWWYYPELLMVQPWGVLQLPFFPTVVTLLVSIGAGIGAVSGALLVRGLIRSSRPRDGAAYGAAVATGGGSGVASLATLGACCCSGCASGGGLALVAAASGTDVPALLNLAWYLPFFQLVVVYLILIAQERALRRAVWAPERPPKVGARMFVGVLLRFGLLVAGLTWSLTMFVEWSTTNPWTASAADWYHWIFEHQLLSFVAIAFALFPREVAEGWNRNGALVLPKLLRLALGVAGLSWGAWVPPALVGAGLGGFVNELFGTLGLPSAWGAVPPDSLGGALLAFHWGFQHLLLSGFAVTVAAKPSRAARPILWSVAEEYTAGGRPSGAEPVSIAREIPVHRRADSYTVSSAAAAVNPGRKVAD